MNSMSILESIESPAHLASLDLAQMNRLAGEIRDFLIDNVTKTGGHLGPNLGVVELTIALHRVFDSPEDPIIFDTGHQSYVHKILTGRWNRFETLRQEGGLSGYPSRSESPHDWVENSHASTSLSWAEGMASAMRLDGNPHTVVAVVGDGALTGGMTWEALNTIAVEDDLRLVIVINDNGRSYRPTVGGLAKHLSMIRTNPRYEPTLEAIKKSMTATPLIGERAYGLLHGVKAGLKDVLMPQDTLYADLGIKYLGPVNGHHIGQLIEVLELAKGYRGPVIVHAITKKGYGYQIAELNQADQFHAIGTIDSATGKPLETASGTAWSQVFSDEIVAIGRRRLDVVAITAAMLQPVGLEAFADEFPDRIFDVGIAEQQAVTSAAGLAMAGKHPVVAVYSTFLNRAFDQLLLDVSLHHQGVTFVLDRAGITGSDGPSHNGMWDVPMLSMIPSLMLTSPRDEKRLREALNEAMDVSDRPTVIRYSKDFVPEPIEAECRRGSMDILVSNPGAKVAMISSGQLTSATIEAARSLEKLGIPVDVIDPLWVLPLHEDLVETAESYDLVMTVEDNLVVGGIGSQLGQVLMEKQAATRVLACGIPKLFPDHGSRASLLTKFGLTAPQLVARVRAALTK